MDMTALAMALAMALALALAMAMALAMACVKGLGNNVYGGEQWTTLN